MYVDVEGARLWVEQDGDGPPVLVPTGAGVEFYRRTFSRRLRNRVHIFYVEMRGSGGSTGSVAGSTFESLADDLDAARVGLGLDRAIVLGQSNHGCIALEHGLRHPEGCAGVVSVGSFPDGRQARAIGMRRWEAEATSEQRADLAERQAAFALLDPTTVSADEYAVRRYFSVSALGWRDPDLAQPSWGGFPIGAGAFFDLLSTEMPRYDGVERIAGLRPPLLAITGRTDYLCPLETWEAAMRVVPEGRLEVIDDAAHNPQAEAADQFDDLVLSFVEAAFA